VSKDNEDKICSITGADFCELASLREEFIGVRSDMVGLVKTVQTHDRILFGNGKVGMKEGYDKMTVKVGAMLWLQGALIVALLANVVALIMGAYK